jgi:predicted DsbA family dithiol-disulfide isomerase
VRTDKIEKQYSVPIRWTVYPLHPEIPEQGVELSVLFPQRSNESPSPGKGRIRSTAEELGLPLGAKRTTISNSRRAQELGKWAEAMGKGDRFRRGVFQAYFVGGHNIAQIPVLEEIARSAGLPADQVSTVLEHGRFADGVDADWRRARELGIMAVPFFLYGEETLVGFRPFEDFLKLLEKDS